MGDETDKRRFFYSGVVIPNIKTAQQDAPVQQCLIRNSKNKLVADRSINTKNITEAILGPRDDIRYTWNMDDPNVLKIRFKGLDIFTRVSRKFFSAGDDVASAESALPIRRRPWKLRTGQIWAAIFTRFWKNRHIHDSREIKTKEDKTKGVFQAFFLAAEKNS